MQGRKVDRKVWFIYVTDSLDNAVERAVRTRGFFSKSDFIRECVRRELDRLGIRIHEVVENVAEANS